MTQPPVNPPPGWYDNSRGQRQWWDGIAWGSLAAATPQPAAQVSRTARNVAVAVAVVATVIVLSLLYAGRLLWLSVGATEGDIPPASAVPLPAGSEILGETSDCASGGCWTNVTIRPPEGQSAEALAEELGATPQLEIPGDFWDPRSVWVSARPTGSVLVLILDYYSEEWVP
ncbi:hypothetical protein ACI7YT_10670 [Microbacterium sp. M]|uniref:hypothetical protein n=1 Tax=Microbacterium sp. M TaxID=3377125 RepID=UPI003865B0A3